jgi:hypothetical protein
MSAYPLGVTPPSAPLPVRLARLADTLETLRIRAAVAYREAPTPALADVQSEIEVAQRQVRLLQEDS